MSSQDSDALLVAQNKKSSILANLWFGVTLRPYGNDLLTRGGRSHLLTVSVLMFVVALVEGVSWGYFGSTMGPSKALSVFDYSIDPKVLMWCIFGFSIFSVMWFFDRSLVTSDLEHPRHAYFLEGKDSPKDVSIGWFKKYILNSFSFRIGLAVLSLWITTPYVTELAFKADIENKQAEFFQAEVSSQKEAYVKAKNDKISNLDKKIDDANKRIQAETAGGKESLSGNYGRGPVVQAIEQERADLQSQKNLEVSTKNKRVADIEDAVKNKNFDQLSSLGIQIDQDSSMLRKKAVAEIKRTQEKDFDGVEWTIRGLLILLFTLLFTSKIMQSVPVKLYYSSRLQEKWRLYCLKAYDKDLLPEQQSDLFLQSKDALPEEFERMMADYAKNSVLRQKRIEKEAEIKAKKEKSELAHYERLVKEGADLDLAAYRQQFALSQILSALKRILDQEQEYLNKYSADIQILTTQDQKLGEQWHEMERIYKTLAERIESRKVRIADTELQIGQVDRLFQQERMREDADRFDVLQWIESLANALIRQKERLSNQRAELLGFENTYVCYEENRAELQRELDLTRTKLSLLRDPLDEIIDERQSLEKQYLELASKQGFIESPYVLHNDDELPFKVEKMRKQESFVPHHPMKDVKPIYAGHESDAV